jgi:hypothetical protein
MLLSIILKIYCIIVVLLPTLLHIIQIFLDIEVEISILNLQTSIQEETYLLEVKVHTQTLIQNVVLKKITLNAILIKLKKEMVGLVKQHMEIFLAILIHNILLKKKKIQSKYLKFLNTNINMVKIFIILETTYKNDFLKL